MNASASVQDMGQAALAAEVERLRKQVAAMKRRHGTDTRRQHETILALAGQLATLTAEHARTRALFQVMLEAGPHAKGDGQQEPESAYWQTAAIQARRREIHAVTAAGGAR